MQYIAWVTEQIFLIEAKYDSIDEQAVWLSWSVYKLRQVSGVIPTANGEYFALC